MPKFQLDWEIECDFDLYGVGSHVGSHRLCFELNKLFSWNLRYDRMVEGYSKSGTSKHIVHRHLDNELGLDIAVILNRVPDGILDVNAASFDYIIRVRKGYAEDLEIIKTIRKSNLVTLVTTVDPEKSTALDAMFELDKI